MDTIINEKIFEESNSDVFVWKTHKNLGYYSHFHDAIEIYFIKSGSLEARINGETCVATKDDILIVNPLEIHMYKRSEQTTVNVLILGSNYLQDFYHFYNGKVFKHQLADKEYNLSIISVLDNVTPSFNNNTTLTKFQKKVYANIIFEKIISHYPLEDNKTNESITDIVTYILANHMNEITLESLAKQFNYAKTSMSRLLSKYLQVDLRQFINNIRVEEANKKLNDPNFAKYTIANIAFSCGFNSMPTFYRTYKLRYKKSPER